MRRQRELCVHCGHGNFKHIAGFRFARIVGVFLAAAVVDPVGGIARCLCSRAHVELVVTRAAQGDARAVLAVLLLQHAAHDLEHLARGFHIVIGFLLRFGCGFRRCGGRGRFHRKAFVQNDVNGVFDFLAAHRGGMTHDAVIGVQRHGNFGIHAAIRISCGGILAAAGLHIIIFAAGNHQRCNSLARFHRHLGAAEADLAAAAGAAFRHIFAIGQQGGIVHGSGGHAFRFCGGRFQLHRQLHGCGRFRRFGCIAAFGSRCGDRFFGVEARLGACAQFRIEARFGRGAQFRFEAGFGRGAQFRFEARFRRGAHFRIEARFRRGVRFGISDRFGRGGGFRQGRFRGDFCGGICLRICKAGENAQHHCRNQQQRNQADDGFFHGYSSPTGISIRVCDSMVSSRSYHRFFLAE